MHDCQNVVPVRVLVCSAPLLGRTVVTQSNVREVKSMSNLFP